MTGVVEDFDMKGTISLALQLHPQLKTVVFLSDATASGELNLFKIHQVMPDFKETVEFLELSNLSAEELQQELLRPSAGRLDPLPVILPGSDGENVFDPGKC